MENAEQLKAQLKALQAQRAQLEAQIAVRTGRLQTSGVGMDAPLVDREVRRRELPPAATAQRTCLLLP